MFVVLLFLFLPPAAAQAETAVRVRGETAGDDQADSSCGPFGKVSGKSGKPVGRFFQTGVHGSHQYPVLQRGESEVEGGEELWVPGISHRQ